MRTLNPPFRGLTVPFVIAVTALGSSWWQAEAQILVPRGTPSVSSHIVKVQATGENPVSASELKDAIADIKRRLAEQQEGRQSTGTGELTAELKAARETISDLTQGMNRLRGERDEIMSEMRDMGNELSLRSEQIANLERELETATAEGTAALAALQADLDARRTERDAAQDELANTASRLETALAEITDLTAILEQARAEGAELGAQLAETRRLSESDLSERDRVVAAAEAEIDRLGAELERMVEQESASAAAVTELRIQLEAMTSAALTGSQDAESASGQITTLETALDNEQQARAQAETELVAQRERVRQVAQEAEGRLKERTATLTSSIQTAEQRINELETELTGLREVATTSVGEVQVLGEQLLDTLQENEELVTALTEVRASKTIIEDELAAARRDVDLYASQAALSQRGESGAVIASLQGDLQSANEEIKALTEELIKQEQLSATDSDQAGIDARLNELEAELAASENRNLALSEELEALKGAADTEASSEPPARPVQLASIGDEQIDGLLRELNAVETGDGWIMMIPEGIVFAPGSDQLADAATGPLTQVAAMLRYFDGAAIRIVGHTDSYGDPDINRILSVARAESVRDFLIENFDIDDALLQSDGFGEERPIASNDSVSGRRANRRVEVYVEVGGQQG